MPKLTGASLLPFWKPPPSVSYTSLGAASLKVSMVFTGKLVANESLYP